MFGPLERWIAARYLRPRREEGFVSVIAGFSLMGIMLGVATLIIVMSVMNGFRSELMGRILGLNGHIGLFPVKERRIENFDPLVERLRAVTGVISVTPIVEGQVMVSARGIAAGGLVRGIREEDFRNRPILNDNIKSGSLDRFGDEDSAVIGSQMARRLAIHVGDRFTLLSPEGTPTAFGTVPRSRSYVVAAIFEVGMYEYDNTFIYLPLSSAQIFFRLPEAVNNLEVMLDNPDRTAEIRPKLSAALGDAELRFWDWRQANSSFFSAIRVERNVMFVILTLIILVAAFNIISGLTMLVKDKSKDIAILRTMGATRGTVLRIFVMTGASIGVTGTGLGVVLGLAFARNIDTIRRWLERLAGTELWSPEIRFLSELPAIVDPMEVLAVVLMALGLSFLATIYPAWRAARLDPVEALRYE